MIFHSFHHLSLFYCHLFLHDAGDSTGTRMFATVSMWTLNFNTATSLTCTFRYHLSNKGGTTKQNASIALEFIHDSKAPVDDRLL